MATLKTRWLLSIWLVSLSECSASEGPPAPPSRPECLIPCDKNCDVDIHCTWEPRPDPQIPTKYTLHWEPANKDDQHVISGSSSSHFIDRENFSNNDDLRVWVQAKNQHGSSKSPDVEFNPADIYKPSPPNVTTSDHQESLEIDWSVSCDLQHTVGHCDVQHRTEEDREWLQVKEVYRSFALDNPRPCTVYEFQVRCSCGKGLMSNWSAVHIARSEIAPVAELDVWVDCGIIPESSDCVLTWKELPPPLACGLILGYEVRLSYINRTVKSVNLSTAEPRRGLLVCEEMQCQFNSSLKDVASVSVSAYNRHGASVPSNLSVPVTAFVSEKNEQEIHLKVTEENLTVSWKLPHRLSVNLTEYVVQYKQAGRPLGRGFDWVKVSKNQKTATFKGQFKKYTPFQVSLISVSRSNQIHHLLSAVGYSLEGLPSKVPSFKHSSSATRDTLTWEHVPLLERNGIILYYQIGVNGQNVYNVSASSHTSELLHLRPGHEYEVWIRAVTAAGPGERSTFTFTSHQEHEGYLTPIMLGIFLPVAICICVALLCACQGGRKVCPLMLSCFYEKVPDPRNSHIFRQVKNQMRDRPILTGLPEINDPLGWICIPEYEPHPKISLLVVVERSFISNPKKTFDPEGHTRPVVPDGFSPMDSMDDEREDAVTEETHRTDRKYGTEAYSKIVDSDEERDEEKEEEREDCWSSSTEELFESGYEKHFMPTALEILEVA
ncbi:interleukin 12 receptor, beta 2a, like [Labrus mixtus]|uniref:interleukin 12 receptor, beta 2a, like n=1 Tax=Labrus mixtus TaxID=508554 RepID=UPI0029C011B5|nr:interleukin 12 receptor, beta 2a, like [Labrus mixtus]